MGQAIEQKVAKELAVKLRVAYNEAGEIVGMKGGAEWVGAPQGGLQEMGSVSPEELMIELSRLVTSWITTRAPIPAKLGLVVAAKNGQVPV